MNRFFSRYLRQQMTDRSVRRFSSKRIEGLSETPLSPIDTLQSYEMFHEAMKLYEAE